MVKTRLFHGCALHVFLLPVVWVVDANLFLVSSPIGNRLDGLDGEVMGSYNQPACIAPVNPKVGAVFASSFCKDLPFLLAVGGSKGNLHVWNSLQNPEVARRFWAFAS